MGRARDYTNLLLAGTPTADWFRMPPGSVSHIAWQVGHLAFAQYGLTLGRIRGKRPEDDELISPAFLERFRRESVPVGDQHSYPLADEIRRVFDEVHRQAQAEIAALDDSVLDEPVASPHPRFTTKGGAVVWCAEHELLHAGQIGLLRRSVGHRPIW